MRFYLWFFIISVFVLVVVTLFFTGVLINPVSNVFPVVEQVEEGVVFEGVGNLSSGLGNSSVKSDVPNKTRVSYKGGLLDVNITLFGNSSGVYDGNVQDVFLNHLGGGDKFGANISGMVKGEVRSFRYVVESSEELEGDYWYRYVSVDGGRHAFDFYDVCGRSFNCSGDVHNYSCEAYASCEYKKYEEKGTYYLEITFNSDSFIDPTITFITFSSSDSVNDNVSVENGNFSHLSIDTTDPLYEYLILYYMIDENYTWPFDYSDNNYDITTSVNYETVSSIYGIAFYGDGSENKIYRTIPSEINSSGNFSVSFWAYHDGGNQLDVVFNIQGASGDAGQHISCYMDDNDYNGMLCGSKAHNDYSVQPNFSIDTLNWAHFVVVIPNSTERLELYHNGVLVSEAPEIGVLSSYDANVINIGDGLSNTYDLYGGVDEFMVFNKALNSSEVLGIYNNQSGKFRTGGTQTFNFTNSTAHNKLNVTTDEHQELFGSNLTVFISYYNGSWQTTSESDFVDGTTVVFDTPSATIWNVSYKFYDGTNSFYTPLLFGALNFTYWDVVSAPVDNNPESNLSSPPDNTNYTNGTVVTFECNATDDYNLKNVTLYIWNSTDSNIHSNRSDWIGTSNSTQFNFNLTYDDLFDWNCQVFDNASQFDWFSSNWTVNISHVVVVSDALNLDILNPLNDIIVDPGSNFNFTVNVSCAAGSCGEVNLSLYYQTEIFHALNAWSGNGAVRPPSSINFSDEIGVGSGGLVNISRDDDNVVFRVKVANFSMVKVQFNISESPANISNFTVSVKGFGVLDVSPPQPYNFSLYIYNFSSTNWTYLNETVSTEKDLVTGTVFSSVSDYVDGNGTLYGLVVGEGTDSVEESQLSLYYTNVLIDSPNYYLVERPTTFTENVTFVDDGESWINNSDCGQDIWDVCNDLGITRRSIYEYSGTYSVWLRSDSSGTFLMEELNYSGITQGNITFYSNCNGLGAGESIKLSLYNGSWNTIWEANSTQNCTGSIQPDPSDYEYVYINITPYGLNDTVNISWNGTVIGAGDTFTFDEFRVNGISLGTTIPTPFYHNDSNPDNVSVGTGESWKYVFNLVATGENFSVHDLFVTANLTSDFSINNLSDTRQITITDIDSVPPVVTAVRPLDQTYTVNTTFFNASTNEDVTTCFYSLNQTANVSMERFSMRRYFNNISFIEDGIYNVTYCCNDSQENTGCSSVRSFSVDTVPPIISLEYPIGGENVPNGTNLYMNYTPTPDGGVMDTCILYGNWSGGWHANQTDTSITGSVINSFVVNLSEGTYFWNVWCNESSSNSDFSPLNQTFIIGQLPTHTTPLLTSTNPATNDSNQNLTCYNQSTSEGVNNIYNWLVNSDYLELLKLPFEGNQNESLQATDYSPTVNHAEVFGATWNRTGGIIQGAYEFDGVNDYLDISHSTLYDNTGLSLSMWIYLEDNTTDNSIITSGYSGGTPWIHAVVDSSADFKVYFGTGYITLGADLKEDTWYHLVFTMNTSLGLGQGRLYLNGSELGSFTTASASGTGAYLGRHRVGYSFTGWFNGSMDEVILFNRTLTANQIAQLYDDTKDGVTSSRTIVSDETVGDENWTCEITPNDGWFDGTTLLSNQLIVQNVSVGDTQNPNVTSLTETPGDPATYSSGTIYEFNSTVVDDIQVETVILQFDGTNRTATNLTADIYNVTITNLPAGTYNYVWFANDTTGNFNNTEEGSYTINKAGSAVNLTLNLTRGNITILQGDTITLNCSTLTGEPAAAVVIERQGVVSNNSSSPVSVSETFNTAQVENITCFYEASQNYTGSFETWFVNVTAVDNEPPNITAPANASLAYGTSLQTDFNSTDAEDNFDSFAVNDSRFSINNSGTLVNSSALHVATFVLNISVNDTNNNENSTLWQVEVTQAVPQGNLTNWTALQLSYNSSFNFTYDENNGGDADLTYRVYRDDVDVTSESGLNVVLGVGSYTYVFNVTAGQNYTLNASLESFVLNITNNTGNCDVLFNVSSPQTWNYVFLAYTNCNSPFVLQRDGTIITNNSLQDLSVGTYNFTVQRNDSQNYTNTYDEELFTINQRTSVLEGYVNHTQDNFTVQNGSASQNIYLNSTITNPCIGTGNITLNGSNYNSGTLPLFNVTNLSVGYYNVTFEYDGNTNCTSDSVTHWINVSLLDVQNPSVTINYPTNTTYNITITLVNFTATDDTSVDNCNYTVDGSYYGMAFDGTNWLNDTESVGGGSHILNATCGDTSDNINNTESVQFTVDLSPPNITYPANASLTYGNSLTTDFNATDNFGFGYYYINDSRFSINQSGSLTNTSALHVTTYIINVSANDTVDNENSVLWQVEVTQAVPTGNLTNNTILTRTWDGTETTVGLSEGNNGDADLTYIIYKNNVSVGTSDIEGSVGVYNYVLNTSGGQNYSLNASMDSFILNISIRTSVLNGFINHTQDNFTVQNGSGSLNIYLNTTVTSPCVGTGNITLNGSGFNSGTLPLFNVTNLTVGYYNATFGYDGNNNCTSDIVTHWINVTLIDIQNPSVVINLPVNITYSIESLTVNFTGTDDTGIDTCNYSVSGTYYNAVQAGVSWINTTEEYGEGFHTLNAYCNDTSNNLNDSESVQFTIDLTPPNITSPANASLTYGNSLSVVFNSSDNFSFDSFDVNDSRFIINSSGGLSNNSALHVATYILNISVNDTVNNENSTLWQVQVTQAVPTGDLINQTALTLTYNTSFNFTTTENNPGDSDVNYRVYRDGVEVTGESGTNVVLGVGNYTYLFNATTGQNYTANASLETFVLSITNNTGSCDVLFNETSPKVFGYSFRVYTNCNSPFVLRRNGTIIGNNSVQTLGAGTWTFNVTRNDSQNYTNTFDQETFTISQATGEVYTYINNSRANFTATNGTATANIWLNTSRNTGEGTIELWLNGTKINEGSSPLSNNTNLTSGLYNITGVLPSTQNYTYDIETWWVNITPPAPDTTPPYFNNLRNFTHDINTSFSNSITATDDTGISWYWLNDTTYFNINGGTGLITNQTNLSRVEIHWINISVNDTSNNMNSSIFYINITIPAPAVITGLSPDDMILGYNSDSIIFDEDENDILLTYRR
jgi:hypothetical protein